MMKVVLLMFLFGTGILFGEEPSKAHLSKAFRLMKSLEMEKRVLGYKRFHLMGVESLENYEKALNAAHKYHSRALKNLLKQKSVFSQHQELREALESERELVMVEIMKDFKKDRGEIDKVKSGVEGVEKIYEKIEELLAKGFGDEEMKILTVVDALAEINGELVRLEVAAKDGWSDENAPDLDDMRDEVKDSNFDLEAWFEQMGLIKDSRTEVDNAKIVTEHNEGEKWANADHKEFAARLNRARVVMGLGALRLDEFLSLASEGHSEDMERLNFFAHDSPVEGKERPADRARVAKFKGRFSGENIALGYSGSAGNYWAWFYSDGHRFNLFRSGPNTLGVGLSGRHWTMMTGSRRW